MKLDKRLHLLDYLKLATLVAIAILHTNEFIFYEDISPVGEKAPVWFAVLKFARLFSIGGQILVAIIFFLFGFSKKSQKSFFLISAFCLLGQVILALIFQVPEWDIYSYLAFTCLFIGFSPWFYRFHWITVILSLLMLWIPTSVLKNLGTGIVWAVLTGKTDAGLTGSWPLLPWFFLALLFYQAGLLVNKTSSFFRTFRLEEAVTWGIFFLFSLPFLGAYYWTPIGPTYYIFNFNKAPWVFWANFLPFVFIMRLSLVEKVNFTLRKYSLTSFVSGLYWVRYLGITYLISICYLGAGVWMEEIFRESPLVFDIFFVGLIPVSEIICRLLMEIKNRYVHK